MAKLLLKSSQAMDKLIPWKEKIQSRRKSTSFRQFIEEIASWCPMNFYRTDGEISRYPKSARVGRLISAKDFANREYSDLGQIEWKPGRGFFDQMNELIQITPLPTIWQFGITENCQYADTVGMGMKNAYLTICA